MLHYIFLASSLVILAIAIIFQKYPPAKINNWYGYRTKRSMRDQASWDFANAYSSDLMLKYTIVLIAIQIICLLLDTSELISSVVHIGGTLVVVLLPILFTERMLRKM